MNMTIDEYGTKEWRNDPEYLKEYISILQDDIEILKNQIAVLEAKNLQQVNSADIKCPNCFSFEIMSYNGAQCMHCGHEFNR